MGEKTRNVQLNFRMHYTHYLGHFTALASDTAGTHALCGSCQKVTLVAILREHVPEDNYYRKYVPSEGACHECLLGIEEKFIQHLSLEDLPLWVGHFWMFEWCRLLYERRLKEALT